MLGKKQAIVAAATGAWWSYLVLDFLTHAVVLAGWWRATEASWLAPSDLARRIPIAYGVFAIYCASLTILLTIVHGQQPRLLVGLHFGALVGLLFGITSAVGMYCLVQVPTSFLLVGPASTATASAGSGAAAAWILGGARRWSRVAVLFVAGVALFIGGVVAQNVLQLWPTQ